MAIPQRLRNLVGEWEGTSELWRVWLTPAHSESPTRATVTSEADGAALAIRYDWTLDSERHEGLLLISGDSDGENISAAWADSWHSSASLLVMTGGAGQAGRASVTGTYGAEPDLWGWRTELRVEDDSNLELVMFNVTPAGEESMAVRKHYSRLSSPQGGG